MHLKTIILQVVYDFEANQENALVLNPAERFNSKAVTQDVEATTKEQTSISESADEFTSEEDKENARKKAELANKETRKKVSALLEALFASLMKDETKAASKKIIKNKINSGENKNSQNSSDDEDEVIKINFDHSRINRARKSLDKAVDLQKLPVIQEELTLAKKLTTNGDRNDQSGRMSASPKHINLDLGCLDSSWMEVILILY